MALKYSLILRETCKYLTHDWLTMIFAQPVSVVTSMLIGSLHCWYFGFPQDVYVVICVMIGS